MRAILPLARNYSQLTMTRNDKAFLPERICIMFDRSYVDLSGLEWRISEYDGGEHITLTKEGTKEFVKRISRRGCREGIPPYLGTEFRVAEEPSGDIILNIAQEELEEGDLDPYEAVRNQYRRHVLKEGVPLFIDGYRITNKFLNMSRKELRHEILHSHGFDYLEEYGFIEKSNWNE